MFGHMTSSWQRGAQHKATDDSADAAVTKVVKKKKKKNMRGPFSQKEYYVRIINVWGNKIHSIEYE